MSNASELMVRCLENEGVRFIFGVPGEENLAILDALSRSRQIAFVTTRHEQGAAFMADVYGRLTGEAGVCLSTLGPGATNLLTGVGDAFLDRAPLVAITGQVGLERAHKESHQYIDVVEMFRPITKWNTRVEEPDVIPEVVRKAFKIAVMEKPGSTHIELPENVAEGQVEGEPLAVTPARYPLPNPDSVARAAEVLASARRPLVLSGNGVIRRRAAENLRAFAHHVHLPVTQTFMGKGAVDYTDPLSLQTVGLQSRDAALAGLEQADVVVAVGYDLVEYSPRVWNPDRSKRIIHIDTLPAEVDVNYIPEVEIVSEIGEALDALASACHCPHQFPGIEDLRETVLEELQHYERDTSFPMKPQRVIADLRRALGLGDILISDVGAHKLWLARFFPAHEPNTVIISNGFAAMGIAVPGAIAAKLAYPQRRVVAVSGDGGFLMNVQELETAVRLGAAFVNVVWVDSSYGVIEWKQRERYGRDFGVHFGNPDLVALGRAFGLESFLLRAADELLPTLEKALALKVPSLIQVPIDYGQNLQLLRGAGASARPG